MVSTSDREVKEWHCGVILPPKVGNFSNFPVGGHNYDDLNNIIKFRARGNSFLFMNFSGFCYRRKPGSHFAQTLCEICQLLTEE